MQERQERTPACTHTHTHNTHTHTAHTHTHMGTHTHTPHTHTHTHTHTRAHTHTHTHTYAAVRRALWQLLTCDTAAQISRQRKRNQLLPHLCAGVWVCVSSGVTTYSKMSFACSFCCHCWRLTTTANTLTLEALIMEIKNLANM